MKLMGIVSLLLVSLTPRTSFGWHRFQVQKRNRIIGRLCVRCNSLRSATAEHDLVFPADPWIAAEILTSAFPGSQYLSQYASLAFPGKEVLVCKAFSFLFTVLLIRQHSRQTFYSTKLGLHCSERSMHPEVTPRASRYFKHYNYPTPYPLPAAGNIPV